MEQPNPYYRRLRRAPTVIRVALGLVLIAGGILGFLPILGFWMIPLGIAVVLADVRAVQRASSQLRLWWRRKIGRSDVERS